MKNTIKKKLNNFKRYSRKGFTLIELIVVLTMMAIMLGIMAFGTVGWIDWATFKKENDSAEDIFFAAQNQLTELDSSGAMYRVVNSALLNSTKTEYNSDYILLQGRDEIEVGTLAGFKKTDGSNYSWDDVWVGSEDNMEHDKKTIICLNVPSDSYDAYIDDRGAVDPDVRLLFDLIAPYIADKSVLNGAISLEFCPESAQVFAVCYSDKCNAFTYEDESGKTDIKDRTLHEREKSMVGYYGVDTLTAKIKGRSKSADNYRLEVRNAKELSLILSNNNEAQVIEPCGLKYTIKGSYQHNGTYKPLMQFSVSKDDVKDIIEKISTPEAAAKKPVTVEITFSDGLYKSQTKARKFRIPMWYESGKLFLALDMADIQAQSVTYAESFGLFATDENGQVEKSQAQDAFSQTYSFYRFGFSDARFIQAEVSVNNGVFSETAYAGHETANYDDFKSFGEHEGAASTFANWAEGDSDNTYGISNGRHLYNIRFETDYSEAFKTLTPSTPGYIPKDRTRNFVLKADIDWKKDFLGYGNPSERNGLYNSFATSLTEETQNKKFGIHLIDNAQYPVAELNMGEEGYDTDLLPFPSFRVLSFGDSFTQEVAPSVSSNDTSNNEQSNNSSNTKKSYKLMNFDISFAANCIYGIYGKDVQVDIKNHEYEKISKYGKAGALPLGFFAESFGTVEKQEIDDISVSGVESYQIGQNTGYIFTSKVGGFVGDNYGQVSKLYIDVSKEYDDENALIPHESVIRGRSDVGGIVGHQYYIAKEKVGEGEEATIPDSDRSVVIQDCINNADVFGVEYVGGIIGRIYPSAMDNKNTNSTSSKEAFDVVNAVTMGGADLSNYFSDYRITVPVNRFANMPIEKFTIDNCVNHGEISMDKYFANNTFNYSDDNKLRRGFYFGGITGAAFNNCYINTTSSVSYNHNNADTQKVVISNCASYTLYTDSEINDIICNIQNPTSEKLKESKRRFKANFVGGIVGGARYAYILNCSTTPDATEENQGKISAVFGDRYVGGIAGYMAETDVETDATKNTAYTNRELAKIGNEATNYRTNYALINGTSVYGNYAVGGITGAFGRPYGGLSGECIKNNLENAYGSVNAINMYAWPVNSAGVDNSTCHIKGLLNTAIVVGLSYDSKINESLAEERSNINAGLTGTAAINYHYGVGGIAGLSSSKIENADNIITQVNKTRYLTLVGFSSNNLSIFSNPNGNKTKAVSTVQSVINNSQYVTDGVGGLVGSTLRGGSVNENQGGVKFDSKVDTIVFGRNRVGGAVGDTTLTPDNYGASRIANVLPGKHSTGNWGLVVLGKDNVGGLVGLLADAGEEGIKAGLNIPDDFNGSEINTRYIVIGERAVGGIIGTFYGKENESDELINIKINAPANDKVYVMGSLYVGGIAGIQERETRTDRRTAGNNSIIVDEKAKYHIALNNIDVYADCFVGGFFGAMYSAEGYLHTDRIADYSSAVQNVTVDSDMCAAFVTGLYSYNKYGKSVIYEEINEVNNKSYENFKPDIDNEGEIVSPNGLYNISDIDNYMYTKTRGGSDGAKYLAEINKFKTIFDSVKIGVSNEEYVFDMTYFSDDTYRRKTYNMDGTDSVQRGASTQNITANIYVGGLFGYVPSELTVTIKGYRNRAGLYTKEAVQSEEIGAGDMNLYSYLGAVTGRIAKGMTLYECWNSSGNTDETNLSKDTYKASKASFEGVIAEVNAGKIIRSNYKHDSNSEVMEAIGSNGRPFIVRGIGNNTYSYVAGIVGLNGTSQNSSDKTANMAIVDDCINYQEMRGGSAAGIVATVGGPSLIKNCVNNGNVIANGKNGAGCAAGILVDVQNGVSDDALLDGNVNTGLVTVDGQYESEYAAGIAYNTKGNGVFTLCRNYATNLRYAITSSKENMRAKSIKYCLDASATTFKNMAENDTYNGFGNVVETITNDNMAANFYIGPKSPNEPLGQAQLTNVFIANQLYSNGHTFYGSQNSFTSPINDYNEVGEKNDIDELVLAADQSSTNEHNLKSKWSVNASNNNELLTFEICAADSTGQTVNMYADMNEFSIVWDNYIKAELERYYNYADILATDAKESDEAYRTFVGTDDSSSIYRSFRDIAREEITNDIDGIYSGISGDPDRIDTYAFYVYNDMVNNYPDYLSEDNTSEQKMQSYISLLKSDISSFNNTYSLDTSSEKFEGFVSPLDMTFIDYAVQELNFGSDEASTDYNNRYYLSDSLNYSTTNRENLDVNRESFMTYSSTDAHKDIYDYFYATYKYMLNDVQNKPNDSQELYAYYVKLLRDNISTYGISSKQAGSQATYAIKYNVIFYDVSGEKLSIGNVQTNIGASEYSKQLDLNFEDIKDEFESLGDDVTSTTLTSITDSNEAAQIYKSLSFDFSKISKIVVIVNDAGSNINSAEVGIRGFLWKGDTDAGSSGMVRPDSQSADPYRKAMSLASTIKVLDDYYIPLQKLYFNNTADELPNLAVYKYPTNMKNIDINKYVANASDKINLTEQYDPDDQNSPQYFSADYLNNKTLFSKDTLDKSSVYRYHFYREIDAKYVNMMSGVYPK